ncbi:MAG: T9SS type A sorting domain-containing protein, partial [Bacteroidales bacterium]|nr:T9SS type A sorting domain-containing protein [Bacteroidales bacterium]
LTTGLSGVMHNRLVIDNNERLYCFWYTGLNLSGRTFYRYKDIGTSEWSEVYNPYDSVFFEKIVADINNDMHAIGTVSKPDYSWYKFAYFRFNNGIWNIPIEISPETQGNRSDLDVDNEGYSHIIWQQKSPQSPPEADSILYRFDNNGFWSFPEYIVENADHIAICLDEADNSHIVLTEETEDEFHLKYYNKTNGSWEGKLIDQNNYTFYHTKLSCMGNYLYLTQGVVDTAFGLNGHTNIVFRKMNLITSITKSNSVVNNVNIFPNPFRNQTFINFTMNKLLKLRVDIFDTHGNIVTTLINENVISDDINLEWNGIDNNGAKVNSGLYYIRIQQGNIFVTKPVELLK